MRSLGLLLLLVASTAHAEDVIEEDAPPPPRPLRLSVGGGGSLLLLGQGDLGRQRVDGHLEVLPGGTFGRYGVIFGARHVTYDPVADEAVLTAGLAYEAAAARPRLTLDLHADVGWSLGSEAPVVGGGVLTHLWIVPKYVPIALGLDVTAHMIIDGVDDTRLVIASSTQLSIAF